MQSAGKQIESFGWTLTKIGCSGFVLFVLVVILIAALSSSSKGSNAPTTATQEAATTEASQEPAQNEEPTTSTLERVALSQSKAAGSFEEGDHLEKVRTSGEWAIAQASGVQPEAIMFHEYESKWFVYAAGTDIEEENMPAAALKLLRGGW
jgi:hypothetical protein